MNFRGWVDVAVEVLPGTQGGTKHASHGSTSRGTRSPLAPSAPPTSPTPPSQPVSSAIKRVTAGGSTMKKMLKGLTGRREEKSEPTVLLHAGATSVPAGTAAPHSSAPARADGQLARVSEAEEEGEEPAEHDRQPGRNQHDAELASKGRKRSEEEQTATAAHSTAAAEAVRQAGPPTKGDVGSRRGHHPAPLVLDNAEDKHSTREGDDDDDDDDDGSIEGQGTADDVTRGGLEAGDEGEGEDGDNEEEDGDEEDEDDADSSSDDDEGADETDDGGDGGAGSDTHKATSPSQSRQQKSPKPRAFGGQARRASEAAGSTLPVFSTAPGSAASQGPRRTKTVTAPTTPQSTHSFAPGFTRGGRGSAQGGVGAPRPSSSGSGSNFTKGDGDDSSASKRSQSAGARMSASAPLSPVAEEDRGKRHLSDTGASSRASPPAAGGTGERARARGSKGSENDADAPASKMGHPTSTFGATDRASADKKEKKAKGRKGKRSRKNSVSTPSTLCFERRYLVLVDNVLHLLKHKPTPDEEEQLTANSSRFWEIYDDAVERSGQLLAPAQNASKPASGGSSSSSSGSSGGGSGGGGMLARLMRGSTRDGDKSSKSQQPVPSCIVLDQCEVRAVHPSVFNHRAEYRQVCSVTCAGSRLLLRCNLLSARVQWQRALMTAIDGRNTRYATRRLVVTLKSAQLAGAKGDVRCVVALAGFVEGISATQAISCQNRSNSQVTFAERFEFDVRASEKELSSGYVKFFIQKEHRHRWQTVATAHIEQKPEEFESTRLSLPLSFEKDGREGHFFVDFRHRNLVVLEAEEYEPLLDWFQESGALVLMKLIDVCLEEGQEHDFLPKFDENFFNALAVIFTHRQQLVESWAIELVILNLKASEEENPGQEDSTSYFRSNGVMDKLLQAYVSVHASSWLQDALTGFVEDVIAAAQQHGQLVLGSDSKTISDAQRAALRLFKGLWSRILSAKHKFPASLRRFFSTLYEEAKRNGLNDGSLRLLRRLLKMIVFHRFIISAIAQPHFNKLTMVTPDPISAQWFKALGTLLKNLVFKINRDGVFYSEVNAFVEDQRREVQEMIEFLLREPQGVPMRRTPLVESRLEMATVAHDVTMYRHIIKKHLAPHGPAFEKLLDIADALFQKQHNTEGMATTRTSSRELSSAMAGHHSSSSGSRGTRSSRTDRGLGPRRKSGRLSPSTKQPSSAHHMTHAATTSSAASNAASAGVDTRSAERPATSDEHPEPAPEFIDAIAKIQGIESSGGNLKAQYLLLKTAYIDLGNRFNAVCARLPGGGGEHGPRHHHHHHQHQHHHDDTHHYNDSQQHHYDRHGDGGASNRSSRAPSGSGLSTVMGSMPYGPPRSAMTPTSGGEGALVEVAEMEGQTEQDDEAPASTVTAEARARVRSIHRIAKATAPRSPSATSSVSSASPSPAARGARRSSEGLTAVLGVDTGLRSSASAQGSQAARVVHQRQRGQDRRTAAAAAASGGSIRHYRRTSGSGSGSGGGVGGSSSTLSAHIGDERPSSGTAEGQGVSLTRGSSSSTATPIPFGSGDADDLVESRRRSQSDVGRGERSHLQQSQSRLLTQREHGLQREQQGQEQRIDSPSPTAAVTTARTASPHSQSPASVRARGNDRGDVRDSGLPPTTRRGSDGARGPEGSLGVAPREHSSLSSPKVPIPVPLLSPPSPVMRGGGTGRAKGEGGRAKGVQKRDTGGQKQPQSKAEHLGAVLSRTAVPATIPSRLHSDSGASSAPSSRGGSSGDVVGAHRESAQAHARGAEQPQPQQQGKGSGVSSTDPGAATVAGTGKRVDRDDKKDAEGRQKPSVRLLTLRTEGSFV